MVIGVFLHRVLKFNVETLIFHTMEKYVQCTTFPVNGTKRFSIIETVFWKACYEIKKYLHYLCTFNKLKTRSSYYLAKMNSKKLSEIELFSIEIKI